MEIHALALALTAFSVTALAQSLPVGAAPAESDGFYQVRYLANLDKGDSYVNLTNAGTLDGMDPAGRICVNVYTFDPAEEMISCCACEVTPNALNSLSARTDLISNTLTPGVPTSITVKLVSNVNLIAFARIGQAAPVAGCDPSSPSALQFGSRHACLGNHPSLEYFREPCGWLPVNRDTFLDR